MNQPNVSCNSTTKLQTVPWYSKQEWLDVYYNAFSSDFQSREKAYTQMCIWKARYPNLPLGVECTMSTLEVKLCDKEGKNTENSNNYEERDLQLLYSTVVMRFLNHLTVLSDRKDSMYKMAEQHRLPDWIINLRHEAAHGNTVPALYLLRQAADIILQWLKDNYWEVEKDIMKDVIRQPELKKERINSDINKLLDLWVKLKINYWSELMTVDKIEDENVKKLAMELASKGGFGAKTANETGNKKIIKNTKTSEYTVGDVVMEDASVNQATDGNTDNCPLKIKTAFDPVLTRLFEPLTVRTYKKDTYKNCLVDCLICHTSFCPSINVEQLSDPEVLELMALLEDLWKEVVEGLQELDLLHLLVKQLMEQDNQLTAAQLWLRLLSQLLAGHPPPHPPGSLRVASLFAKHLPSDVKPELKVLTQRMNLLYTKMNKPIKLRPASADEISVLQELGRRVVDDPTRFTSQYLHSLLSLWEPKLSWETREKLCALARIYNGRQPLKNPPLEVYTCANLQTEKAEELEREEASTAPVTIDGTERHPSPWTLYSGDADWSKCALGALPW